eukprot:11793755-Alexandrium_andersonii.AAC.1
MLPPRKKPERGRQRGQVRRRHPGQGSIEPLCRGPSCPARHYQAPTQRPHVGAGHDQGHDRS